LSVTSITVAVYALLGFFLVPWLVGKGAIQTVRENFDAELRLEKVEVNPFLLTLRLRGFELDDPDGSPAARAAEIFINFQLSSLFRWAWTFDEFRVIAPELFIARDGFGNLNLAFLFGRTTEQVSSEQDSSLTRMLIYDFAIEDCAINWNDEVPVEMVKTRFGPIDIRIQELNTLPQRSGQQSILITTESSGTLSWTGTLQLNPFQSVAHASIKGSHFPLTSAYIRHETGFDIVQGNADAELDYTIETVADGSLRARIDNFNLAFNDVVVNTFSGNADSPENDREVVRLAVVRLADGALRWPERTIDLASLIIDDTRVTLNRDESGLLNVQRASSDHGVASVDEDTVDDAQDRWQLSLGQLEINHLALGFEDHSVSPYADIEIADLNLSVSEISNKPGARFPGTLVLRSATGGTLTTDGIVSVLPDLVFDLNLNAQNMALARAHPYIKPLADVSLDSGALNLTGNLSRSDLEPLLFTGDFEIADFAISETDERTRLGSWERMSAERVVLSVAEQKLEISEIRLERPYGDLVIAQDGSLNLGRVEKTGGEKTRPESDVKTPSRNSQMAVTIGQVVLTQGAANFTDYSLPLPFSATIEDLNGNLTTISTESSEPSTVSFEGKVDEHGFVRITGSITPLSPSTNTNLRVSFQNVNVPKFTAYTIPFAGREIESGSLDLELGYQLKKSELVGENKIILRDFELGEKVPHPDAMSLPLGLAVALLKDVDGKIDIDLPVRGNIDDPEFSYGGVVLKAVVNLVVKIVASPFALLGNLVGAEASDLEYVNFLDGRSDLTPPEMQKVAKLAEALSLRPKLTLEIAGVANPEADGLALRTARLDAIVDERIVAMDPAKDKDGMHAELQKKALEQLFVDQQLAEDAEIALQELRDSFMISSDADGEDGQAAQFDALAYTNELRRQLIEVQTVTNADLTILAKQRAQNTQAAILASDEGLRDRIVLGTSSGVAKKSGEMIKMKVTLSTRTPVTERSEAQSPNSSP
jgi:hypothetical protein